MNKYCPSEGCPDETDFRLCACLPRLAGALLALFGALTSPALEPSSAEKPLLLLEQHCIGCHGPEKQKGGLDLSTRAGLVRGGASGRAIVEGKPEESLLIQLVRHEKEPGMPHKEEPLSTDGVSILLDWVAGGAPYARDLKSSAPPAPDFQITEVDRRHWAFQPITRPQPPILHDGGVRANNAIDLFILEKLDAAGLKFAPPASREQFIRRVSLDLTGLLPAVEEIDAFVSDPSPDACEHLIDRLLASPRYGERWGRHWLDLARYAETDGFELDAIREHTWRYRDYVIQAFNDDKPYDQFIREQIAGDELWPDRPEAVIATGFNLLGPDMVDSSDQVQRRHNTLNDMTDTLSLTFLGLTMGCARCHDHKFEPLSQKDYYQVQAFFTAAKFQRDRPIPTDRERHAYEQEQRAYDSHPKIKAVRDFEAPIRERVYQKKLAALPEETRQAHLTRADLRSEEQSNLVLETLARVSVSGQDLENALTEDEKAGRKKLIDQAKRVPRPRPLPKALAFGEKLDDARAFLLRRGDYKQPADEVLPGVPAIFDEFDCTTRLHKSGGRSRAQLAGWIASPNNPLTARVMVNRIWQHHFGRGLVATPNDFGTRGAKPTHPELLDWLASEFMQGGWRIKPMHKLMLMSATYRQTAVTTGENDLYAGMNLIRLEGEAIRDTLLQVSGRLEEEIGGPGVYPPIPKGLFAGAHGWGKPDPAAERRRSIYIFVRRNLRFPFLEVFDAPDNNLSCARREQSTTAPQSLTLLNSSQVVNAAELTASRVLSVATQPDDQVTLLYRLVLGRRPSSQELAIARDFLARSPMRELCRALFNLNEFVYVR